MTRFASPLAFALATLLGACRSEPMAAATSLPPASSAAAALSLSELRLRGEVIVGNSGLYFVPCGTESGQTIVFGPEAQTFIANFADASKFFIDAWGVGSDKAEWRIRRIERVNREGLDCNENLTQVVFKARGNEPFWSLTVSHGQLRFDRPDAASYQAAYFRRSDRANNQHFYAENKTGRLHAVFARQPCQDGMADAMSAWTAEVRFGQQSWRGCAYAGMSAE